MKKPIFAMFTVLSVGVVTAGWLELHRWNFVWSTAAAAVIPVSNRMPSEAPAERLEVKISGLRSDKGHVLAVLFSNSENFPDKPTGTPVTSMGAPQGGEVKLTFEGVPPQNYAVAVIHDEDDDGKMNKGFLGIPTEGFGFSNDAPTFMGPPSYKACEFQKQSGPFSIQMKMKYM